MRLFREINEEMRIKNDEAVRNKDATYSITVSQEEFGRYLYFGYIKTSTTFDKNISITYKVLRLY